jgi:hypothetical protein
MFRGWQLTTTSVWSYLVAVDTPRGDPAYFLRKHRIQENFARVPQNEFPPRLRDV